MSGISARALAALALVGALTVPGVVISQVTSAAAAPAKAPKSNSSVTWTACADEVLDAQRIQCARLVVPADREDPSAGTFSLALARHRASGPVAQRIGSLVFNPGGPGGSGVDAISSVWDDLPTSVRERFDLVTWDPRGVGRSTPALQHCAAPMPARPAVGPVDWASVVRDFDRTLAEVNRRCQSANADIIEQLSTMENVEDLDRIRAALGDEGLNFWGMSYGTRIGYVYALEHPDRVRAMVLDGSVDPAGTLISLTEGGVGPDQAYGVFADAYPEADRMLRQVLDHLDGATVSLPGVTLTRWDVRDVVYGAVASQAAYPVIAALAARWHTAIFGSGTDQVEAAAAAARSALAFRSQPNTNAGAVFSVVNCLDYGGRPTVDQSIAAVRRQVRLAPEYGGSLSTMYARNCAGLDLRPDPVPLITGRGPDVPVLILGATRDGSTVVQWTARMSRAFPASRTVTYAGGQHVVWGMAGSACVNAAANRYMLRRVLPEMDRGCSNSVRPTDEQASP